MTDALVTITSPKDPSAQIPFIWGQAPLRRVVVASWIAKSLKDLGFEVEVHEEPYDPVAVHNGAESYQPVVTPVEPVAEEVAPVAPVAVETPVEPVAEEVAPVAPVAVEAPVDEDAAVEETVTEEAAVEDAAASDEAGDTISDEELAELRSRIEALSSVAAANQLAEEYGMEIPEGMTKLKDIKAHLLSFTEVA